MNIRILATGKIVEAATIQRAYQDTYGSRCIECGSPVDGREYVVALDARGEKILANEWWDTGCRCREDAVRFEVVRN